MSAERWYCVSRQGFASLCPDEADARAEVVNFDRHYPEYAPHRAVRLVDAAEVEALRADAERYRTALERIARNAYRDHAAHVIANDALEPKP